jgi:tetratricopeptide (TPR) repeat protein
VAELTEKFNQAELEHWRMCVEHYPTDLGPKYEYGARLMNKGSYDEAIPLLQESQRDPRRKFASMSRIGQCFFGKGWHTDAAEIFSRAIEEYETKNDAMGKDLRYNLGLCYEQLGRTAEALEVFRKIAQVDFGYRDVSKRVDALRSGQQ